MYSVSSFWNWKARLPFYINPPSPTVEFGSSSVKEKEEHYPTIPASMFTQPESSSPASATTPPPDKQIYEIDGEYFSTLDEFYETISNNLIPGQSWGHNLDAFDDILRGGFGTPSEGFTLLWRNSDVSKQRLGFEETVRQLKKRLTRCHPSNVDSVRQSIRDAEIGKGDTVYEWLVEIILTHSEGGEEGQDRVVLVLN